MSYRYAVAQMFNGGEDEGWATSVPTNMAIMISNGMVFDTEEQAESYIISQYVAEPASGTWYGIVPVRFIPNNQPGALQYGQAAS